MIATGYRETALMRAAEEVIAEAERIEEQYPGSPPMMPLRRGRPYPREQIVKWASDCLRWLTENRESE